MNEGIGFIVVALLVIGFSYGLVKQIHYTLCIHSATKTANYKRLLFGNYLMCMSFAGFWVSFVLNVSIGMQMINSGTITSTGSSASCFIFLVVLLIAKFGITPKIPEHTGVSY